MNKVLIGFNVVLAAAVIYLFVNKPSSGKDEEKEVTTKTEIKTGNSKVFSSAKGDGQIRVAFIQADTLSSQYEFFKEVEAQINDLTQKISKELQAKEQNMMATSQRLQKDFDLKPRSEQEAAYKQMQAMEMSYNKFKEEKMAELDKVRNENLMKAENELKAFLKTYCEQNKIDFVLRDGLTGSLFYGNDLYDITADVAKGLNEQYKKGK